MINKENVEQRFKEIHVVGNAFKNTSNFKNIFTYSQLEDLIESKDIFFEVVFLEQGINEEQFSKIKKVIELAGLSKIVNVVSYFDSLKRCDNSFSHKEKTLNTLISDPRRVDEKTYESYLMIDERCAELSDHVTGKHIQFMLLIESARQMGNAISEKYYSNNKMLFLANNINIIFNKFTYPFKTKLLCSVLDEKFKSDGNGRMKIKIDFFQKEAITCSLEIFFTILNRELVSSLEESAINQYCISK